jgi:hypothetical protein
MGLTAAAYVHDDSGRPLLTAEADQGLADLRAKLEARPAFIHEACGDLDPEQLAAAVNAGDAAAVLALIRAAVTHKRLHSVIETLRHMSPRSDESDALARLVRLYA